MLPDAARYTLDLDAFVEGMMRGTAPTLRRAQVRYAVYAAVFVALWVLSTRLTTDGRIHPTGPLWLACAVGFGILAATRPALYRRQLRRLLAGRADLGHRVEVRLTDADIVIDVEGIRTTTQRLATVATIDSLDEGVLLELLAQEFLWMPASAFPDAASRERFVRHLLERAPLPDPAL